MDLFEVVFIQKSSSFISNTSLTLSVSFGTVVISTFFTPSQLDLYLSDYMTFDGRSDHLSFYLFDVILYLDLSMLMFSQ